ncbi:hypothetical protein DM02DRAFT_671418 [Periconia macrospinosa]|uniref:Zn(2)-C6 fungal-type domain-containing protein n=1 Tax=Periconia macrospinosa TaxID=97972 RepID=A0A2V1DTF5_9PLEO|nr:hypothetical protein DM02DRAFT_671418 [Periconia macrospinosa]
MSKPGDLKPKRTRAYHTRSKLGCLTCRKRRVRCDQARPACSQCSNSGRTCDGYLTAAPTCAVSIAMKLPSVPNLTNHDEHRSLQYFTECTGPQFAGFHEHEFWCKTVLQIGASEQCVFHCVVALASLHEAFESEASPTKPMVIATIQLYKRATSHYTKAISLLNMKIASHGWRSLDVSLLCCILCICFEGLRGSYADAELHLTHGLSLLKQWASNRGSETGKLLPTSTEEIIHNSVAPVFNRLVIQAITVTDTSFPWESSMFACSEIQTFKDYKTARDSLYSMLARFYLSPHKPHGLPPGHSTIVTRMERSIGLSRWFNCYIRSSSMVESSFTLDKSSAAILQATYATARIITETDHLHDQMQFDKYHTEFKEIIKCITTYMASQTPSFSMELGVVSLLHFVSIKCRDPTIRRQAMALNEAARRELIWDSRAARRLEQEILAIEEGEDNLVLEAQDVAASSRIDRLDTRTNLGRRSMTMRFKRQGETEWSEERILSW